MVHLRLHWLRFIIETGGTLKLVIPLKELENGLVVPGKEVYGIYQERRLEDKN